MGTQVHCFYEPGDFDRDEFVDDPSLGQIHDVKPRHTRLGDIVGPGRPAPGGGGGRPLPPADPAGPPPEPEIQ